MLITFLDIQTIERNVCFKDRKSNDFIFCEALEAPLLGNMNICVRPLSGASLRQQAFKQGHSCASASTVLNPYDYFLFPKFKNQTRSRHFENMVDYHSKYCKTS